MLQRQSVISSEPDSSWFSSRPCTNDAFQIFRHQSAGEPALVRRSAATAQREPKLVNQCANPAHAGRQRGSFCAVGPVSYQDWKGGCAAAHFSLPRKTGLSTFPSQSPPCFVYTDKLNKSNFLGFWHCVLGADIFLSVYMCISMWVYVGLCIYVCRRGALYVFCKQFFIRWDLINCPRLGDQPTPEIYLSQFPNSGITKLPPCLAFFTCCRG